MSNPVSSETESPSFSLQNKHILSFQHNKPHHIGWKHTTGNITFLDNKKEITILQRAPEVLRHLKRGGFQFYILYLCCGEI